MSLFYIQLIVILHLSLSWHPANSLNATQVNGSEVKISPEVISAAKSTVPGSPEKETESPTVTSPSTRVSVLPSSLLPTQEGETTRAATVVEKAQLATTTARPQTQKETATADIGKSKGGSNPKKTVSDTSISTSTDEGGVEGGIKLYQDKQPVNKTTEPKIMEITTKIMDSSGGKTDGGVYGPRIDGIEARFEPVKHVIPTKLKEKLDALSCEVPPLPSESTLWNGNETRDLSLPIKVPTECDPEDVECPYGMSLIWEASTEIQSGDVLIIRIDDKTLRRDVSEDESSGYKHPDTAVYQVNRSGHDHCDVNDGTLLDITPLTVDDNKLITLYDKDLTEGINLLIVVSQLWGSQCIRLKVTVKSDNCGENGDCSNKGICFSNVSMEGFECQCCQGYIGPHCEEKDACYPSPCKSNSICVDLSQGHDGETFQCLCPYGFKGKTCEERTDPCESSPCENGAKCSANQTEFHCECPTGYAGERCQHPSDLCSESPCKNGICVSQPDGYKCFCRPGFAGENCEYEFNECESSPCLNGGTCIDQIGGYQCLCGRGYNGKRCHIKVDLCDPEPCPEGRICEDRGNNYSCECPKGYSGPRCNEPLKAVCSSNPCKHGGTCWSSVNSFYCACRPGYSGKTCSQEVPTEEAEMNEKSDGGGEQTDEYSGQNVPLSLRLDKLHNVYIAVGTLACALFIVILTVAICHCRVHETYKKCFINSTPLLPCKIRKLDVLPNNSRTVKPLLGYPKDQMPMPTRNFPTLDTTDVYYTLDFSDNQNAPLIQ